MVHGQTSSVGQTLVLISGLPASGKTTLARSVASASRLPLLSLDVVKESLHDSLALTDRALLRAAAWRVICSLLPDFPHGALVELWIDPSRDREALRRDLGRFPASRVVEIMCVVPGDEAARRYADRPRNYGGHLPPDEAVLARIRRSAALMEPLGLGPALQVDTTRPVAVESIVEWIDRHTPLGSVSRRLPT